MTESEAVKELETSIELAKMCLQNPERKREIEAYKMAINALEKQLEIKKVLCCSISFADKFDAISKIEEILATN